MRRLVVVGTWQAVEADVSSFLTRPLREFQTTIRRDGVRKVRLPGTLRHDCPANATVGAGTDCYVYRLSGRQVVPVRGVATIHARLRLWTDREDGQWQVVNYDYDVVSGA